jgi:hypothetical protein
VGSISGSGVSRRTSPISAGILSIAFAALLWIASSAQAAELVYWDNYEENTVAFANIDGSGGGPLNLAGSALQNPEGMAIDSATGRLFVASAGESGNGGNITAINLDGSGAANFSPPGAPIDVPEGIVVDPVKRMIFWANTGTSPSNGSIAWANLDGSAGGTLSTTGATLEVPYRIGLDPVAGKVYWANSKPAPEIVSFANTDNTGGGDLSLAGAPTPEGLSGFSTDPAAGRLYLLDSQAESVSFVGLGGGNGGSVNLTGATISNPYGLALDPSIGRLYWGNYGTGAVKTGAIGFAATGGGGGAISIATAPVKGLQDPTILKSPTGTEVPTVTRSKKSRSELLCSTGGWAADFAGSFVYQAPHTFAYQWTRNGKAVGGATAATFNAKSAGKYACGVTATNQAGSASQTSAAINEKAAKLKLTAKKASAGAGGVAKFKVKAVNQGDIKSKSAKVCAKVAKKAIGDLKAPKCKSLGKLKGHGKRSATLKVKVGESAEGTYVVTFQVRGAPGKAAKAKLLVR